MSKELWVVRHTAVDMPKGVCYGRTDVGLLDTFEMESQEVAIKLQSFEPDAVFSSPLSRATRLARAVGYDPQLDERLLEQNFGEWELKYYDDITDPQLQKWYENYVDEVPTGGESFRAQVERVGKFIDEIRASEFQKILVFAHGGVQMATGAYLGLYSMKDAPKHFQGYGSVIKYDI
ncbi:alpha-ribazole phosphatase family protein [Porphyromonadaceae bacterium W3.11]|nr:alpha-ribazole phosphatase family protein [Porphyromonadaceae bacterium W3.11]